MRIGIASRGRWFVSLGPLGWLIIGPFYLALVFVVCVVALAWMALRGLVWLLVAGVRLVRRA